jgi:hypothetical protein
MKKCNECGGLNSNSEFFCDYCSNPLPKDKIFTLKEFLQENSQLFTILGVFGALSYYLSTFFLKQVIPNSPWICNNNSTTSYENFNLSYQLPTQFNPLNTTVSGQELISKSHFNFLSPDLIIAFSLFTSFFIFIAVLILINKELLTYLPNSIRYIVWFPLVALLVISVLYVLYLFITSTFLLFLLIAASVIFLISKLFFDLHGFVLCKLKDDRVLSKYVLTGPIILISSLAIMVVLILVITAIFLFIGKNVIFSDLLIDNLIRVSLIGIMFGILYGFTIFGPGIYTWLMFSRILKWGTTDRTILLIGIGCIIAYIIFKIFSIPFINEFTYVFLMIGIIAVVNVYLPRILTYYSLKF